MATIMAMPEPRLRRTFQALRICPGSTAPKASSAKAALMPCQTRKSRAATFQSANPISRLRK
jgi:hypothetical protein